MAVTAFHQPVCCFKQSTAILSYHKLFLWLTSCLFVLLIYLLCFPGGSNGKDIACNARGACSIPGSGRTPGEENGNPLQCSCLENSMDRGTWQATVHGVAKSQIGLSTHILIALSLKKEFYSALCVPSLHCIKVYRHKFFPKQIFQI